MSAPNLDCGDNSCLFAPVKGGMRTNGGCRCLDAIDPPSKRRAVTRRIQEGDQARALLARARDALKREHRHSYYCAVNHSSQRRPCDCGADAANAERAALVADIARAIGGEENNGR